jgi:predicted SAM-dependent methyltransferase
MNTMLNIGCGGVTHPAWINLDLASRNPNVRIHDLRRGLPFADGAVDACYSSHVLEHLAPAEADFFLAQQRRVLKPGGVLRVVVPDLATICRTYCRQLDALLSGDMGCEFPYDYTLLELYDQTVRSVSGGELGKVWQSCAGQDRAYVVSRRGPLAPARVPSRARPTFRGYLRAKLADLRPGHWGPALRRQAARRAVRLCLGRRGLDAFDEGLFRASGEIHRWMYDAFSLARLLHRHGFHQPHPTTAAASAIPHFEDYHLDTLDGQVRKPGSLFMEAGVSA